MSESKIEAIRESFEQALIDGLKGDPVIDQETREVVRDADGSVVRVAPSAQVLAVARAYLKDKEESSPKEPKRPLPQTGKPKGALAEFIEQHGGSLPFGLPKQ